MRSERTVPAVTPISQPFFDAAREGTLVLQSCENCGGLWFPPTTNCPTCLSDAVMWKPVSGKGRIWSWIRMHQPYMSAFKDEIPYVVAFIELEEGPTLVSGLSGFDDAQIACDVPVEVTFEELGPDATPMPFFKPVAA